MKVPLKTRLRRALHGHETVEVKFEQFGKAPYLLQHNLQAPDVSVKIFERLPSRHPNPGSPGDPFPKGVLKAWHHRTLIRSGPSGYQFLNSVGVLVTTPSGDPRPGEYLARITG